MILRTVFFVLLTFFCAHETHTLTIDDSAQDTLMQGPQACTQELEKMFNALVVPRKNSFFHKSVRRKKYDVVQKNISELTDYLTHTPVNTETTPTIETACKILHDKILWIDGFKTGHLKYFSSPAYAERFFEKQDNIINQKAPGHERKKDD